jgi:hypothetical protein
MREVVLRYEKVILYHLWGVFSVYGFTTPITGCKRKKKNCSREVPYNHYKRLRVECIYIHAANLTHTRKEVIVLSPAQ